MDKRFEELRKKSIEETKKKVKESVAFDGLLIQAINNTNEINKVANVLIKRFREWYELYNPEFSREINDHQKFIELILDKKERRIKESMGAELSKEDIAPIIELGKEINELYKLKEKQEIYVEKLMQKHCPNLTAVAGFLIGAKLIALAGNLKRLMEFPSSTVQLLGAEKALFRHMKTGARSPKHGIIHEHPILSRAKEKGKAARGLADKITLAVKVDYFKGKFIGDRLRQELEEKFR